MKVKEFALLHNVVRQRDAAGAERDVEWAIGFEGPDAARRKSGPPLRPFGYAVERHFVLVGGARLEAIEADDRVMVALDRERPRRMVEDLYLAGGVGLHPNRRVSLAEMPQHRPERQFGHEPSSVITPT